MLEGKRGRDSMRRFLADDEDNRCLRGGRKGEHDTNRDSQVCSIRAAKMQCPLRLHGSNCWRCLHGHEELPLADFEDLSRCYRQGGLCSIGSFFFHLPRKVIHLLSITVDNQIMQGHIAEVGGGSS